MKALRKIGVFTGTRAEYGLLYPLIKALHQSPRFEVMLYVSGSHLDPRYGKTLDEIEKDGFPITAILPLPEMGAGMATGCGVITQALGDCLQNPQTTPDCMIVLGDRYETLGVAIAAFLSNVPLAHIHGGDVVRGGMLDDPIRHAVTKLAHLHFPVTQTSAGRILAMGEEPWRVTIVGSPALDNIAMVEHLEKSFFVEAYGLDPDKPWIVFTQHPITTQTDLAGQQVRQTLEVLALLGEAVQVIATYPNHDEGSLDIIQCLEEEYACLSQFQIVKSLGRVRYLNILRYAALMIGNSSSGLLETAHFKLPCINVGERQQGRERGANVVDVPQDTQAIENALRQVLYDDAFRSRLQNGEHPFGDGHCVDRILEVLANTSSDARLLQKQLTY